MSIIRFAALSVLIHLTCWFVPAVWSSTLGSGRADSLLVKVYDNMFTDCDLAQRYLDSLNSFPEVKSFEINHIAGDISFNRGNYFDAVKLYKRSLYDREAEKKPDFRMKMIRKILMCYDLTGNIQRMDHYTEMLERIAGEESDSMMIAVARFNRGKVERERGNIDSCISLMTSAIAIMTPMEFNGRLNELCYYYITIVESLQDAHRDREAMDVLDRMQTLLSARNGTGAPKALELIDSAWAKDVEAHRTVLYSRLGMPDSAEVYYHRFLDSDALFEYDYTCIMPYLTENKLWDDIIRLSESRRNYIEAIGDDSGRDMAYIHRTLGEAWMQKGDYRRAAINFIALDSIQDMLKQQESLSAIDELTMNYEASQAESEQERRVASVKFYAVSIIAVIIIIAIVALLLRERHNTKIIRRKNRWMARTIESMHGERLFQPAFADKQPDDSEDSKEDSEEGRASDDKVERGVFERMVGDIVSQKMYLNPELSRDDLLKNYGIPKNRFSNMFRKYADTSFPRFINALRLEHAVKIMREHPNYTIDAIARDCGIASTVTLYNLFSQQYGMTPSEYRKTLNPSAK